MPNGMKLEIILMLQKWQCFLLKAIHLIGFQFINKMVEY